MQQVSDFFEDALGKLQKNVFECTHNGCGTQLEIIGCKHPPAFPCHTCGFKAWKIYSINDTVIYP